MRHSSAIRLVFISTFALVGLAGCGDPAEQCSGGACVRPAACKVGQASAQFVRQTPPPDLLMPWHHATASVTFANCSGQTWTQGGFALRPARGVEPGTWSVSRVPLPLDVPDQHEITLPFEVVAPAASAAAPFSFAVAHDGVEVFAEPSPLVMVRVAARADCSTPGPASRFRTQVAPDEFVATGAPVHASVTLANCGTETWTRAGGVELGSLAAPVDAWGVHALPLPFDVPPGLEVAIPIEVTAPSHPGRYTFTWQLRQKDAPLGDPTPTTTSVVLDAIDCGAAGPPARFLSQHAPPPLGQGQAADVSARFGNCSGRVWGDGFALDSALPGKARIWGAGPVGLPLPAGPGFAIDVAFQVHAPAPGVHPYRFGVYAPEGEGTLLDEPTPPLDVVVSCIPSCGDHNCGGDGCGGSCGGCPQNWSCDGAHCQSHLPGCGSLQWWNTYLTWESISSGWYDTDLGVPGSTPVQLRHDSRLDHTGVYGWGYMPEFTDLVTGYRFRFLHLRPQHQNAVNIGQVYSAGYIVGLSGGDTFDTGLPKYSTGAHLCVQTLTPYRTVFPTGHDPCQ